MKLNPLPTNQLLPKILGVLATIETDSPKRHNVQEEPDAKELKRIRREKETSERLKQKFTDHLKDNPEVIDELDEFFRRSTQQEARILRERYGIEQTIPKEATPENVSRFFREERQRLNESTRKSMEESITRIVNRIEINPIDDDDRIVLLAVLTSIDESKELTLSEYTTRLFDTSAQEFIYHVVERLIVIRDSRQKALTKQ